MVRDNEMNLREFQREAEIRLIEGKSVIVLAPTGLGKTLAAIKPFINNKVLVKNFVFRFRKISPQKFCEVQASNKERLWALPPVLQPFEVLPPFCGQQCIQQRL